MKDFLLQLKERFTKPVEEEEFEPQGDEYVEVNSHEGQEEKSRVLVRPFVMEEFEDIKEILDVYGRDDGITQVKIPEFFERFKNKKYCILIFLKNPQEIKSFEIDKTGFGVMSAWIAIDDIAKIKK